MKPTTLLLASSLALAAALSVRPARAQQDEGPVGPADPARADLEAAFGEQGLTLDLDAGWCSIPARVCMRDDLLEYLLVADYGASHESLFSTKVTPSVWNTALVALGAEPARGARFTEKHPAPTDEELAAGASPYDVELPDGTPFYAYALWTEDGEARLHRVEDLVGNLRTGRAMRRHALRYVGSRMVKPEPDAQQEVFLADLEGNLLNVHFFQSDKAILSTATEDGVYDTIWIANAWLVPERDVPVQLIVSRAPLSGVPPELEGLVAR